MDSLVDSTDPGCLFCKIIAGQIPAKVAYQDDLTYAFYDIRPQAPKHLLLLPRKHIASLAEIGPQDQNLLGHLLEVVAKVARQEGLSGGFRSVINSGQDGGQTVGHLHIHILGGRFMHWPPG